MSSLKLAAALLVLFMVASSAFADDASLTQALALFVKHGCTQTKIQDCLKGLGDKPSCDELKKSGRCFFKECSEIKGTDDAQKAAELLCKFAKEHYQCDGTPSDLINDGNGAPGSLHRPVGAVLALAVAISCFLVFH